MVFDLDERLRLGEPGQVKGVPVQVCQNQTLNGLCDPVVDCSGFNAVNVAVLVSGTNPSATLTVEGSQSPGGVPIVLPDANATQAGVSATRSFDVVVGTAFIRLRLASVTGTYQAGQGYTVIVTPYISPGQATLALNPATGGFTDRSGTITTGGTAQTAAAANGARKFVQLHNVDATEDLWYSFTGTAAVDGAGSVRLVAKGTASYEGTFVPTSALSVVAATTGHKFTAVEG